MFDYIRCEQPLPDGWQPDELMQTKDFDCELVEYVIARNGRLLCDRGRLENLPDRYLDYKDALKSLREMAKGGLKQAPKMTGTGFHGVVRFGGLEVIGYETIQGHGSPVTYRSTQESVVVGGKAIYKSHDYRAKFDNGRLVEIVMDEI